MSVGLADNRTSEQRGQRASERRRANGQSFHRVQAPSFRMLREVPVYDDAKKGTSETESNWTAHSEYAYDLSAAEPVSREAAERAAAIRDELEAPRFGTPEFRELCKKLDHRSLAYRGFKRAFDFLFALFVVVVGFIPGLLLSIAIAIDTKGSPIYAQERIGKHGNAFRIYKFRSMVKDSDDVEKYFTPEQLEVWKRERKVDNDPRVTRLGRVIRAASLDEVPQFLNVLFGQISLIGPRVITYDELMQHFTDYEKALLLSVTPGITGAWQCGPRNEATFENGQRQAIELEYSRSSTFAGDIMIFFKTIYVMLVKRSGK